MKILAAGFCLPQFFSYHDAIPLAEGPVLKRTDSLKRKKDFRYTYRTGKSVGSRYLATVWAKSRQESAHIGFSVSKKLGNAVTRNRIRRRMREAATPLIPQLKGHVNIIFIAREAIIEAEFDQIGKAMERTLRKADLFAESPVPDEKD